MALRLPFASWRRRTPGFPRADRRIRSLLTIVAAVLLVVVAGMVGLFIAADRGLLDSRIAAVASRRLGRPISFDSLDMHLLRLHPSVDVEGLRVANPEDFGPGAMLTAAHLHVELRAWALIWSHAAVRSLRADGVVLSLVRIGPDHNNWVTPHHRHGLPEFEPLHSLADFQVYDARLRFRDLGRHLDVAGRLAIGRGAAPLRFTGTGQFLGTPINVSFAGGPLHGDAVGQPYPFAAKLQDGSTHVAASGTSVQPFDLSGYHLKVSSDGPNLADLGYLFHLITPNSRPYRLSALATSANGEVRVDNLAIRTGGSLVSGAIWSDHRQPRRDILADFRASTLQRDDINAILAQIPSHMQARSRTGEIPSIGPSRFVVSDAPLGLARLRATDLDFRIRVDRLLGYPLAFENITARFDIDHGILSMPSFQADLFGGTVRATGRIDARSDLPDINFSTRLRGVSLSSFPGATSTAASGTVDSDLEIAGRGISFHAAAASGRGHLQIALRNLVLPKAAEWMLAGDLIRGASAAFGRAKAQGPVTIAAGPFAGSDGLLLADRASALSVLGRAQGDASVDFQSERFCLLLVGRPARKRLFQVAAPVRIEGPWLRPTVHVLPGDKARALGLHGTLGTILTPIAGLIPAKRRPPEQCR